MSGRGLTPWGRGRSIPSTRLWGDENPFLSLHREMNRMFDDFFRGDVPLPQASLGPWSTTWPHVEVSETNDAVKVVAEVPGLEEKDVELTLNDNVLTLKGEKKVETQNPLYTERWQGQFQRSVQLGSDVDPERVEATFNNGVLTITLPKRPEVQGKAKRIEIKGK